MMPRAWGETLMRILIVDDEPAVANVLADAISAQGHGATVVYRGDDALARLGEMRYDAVFLDVLMPGMSGIDVLRRIRATQAELPVIVITGHAQEYEIQEARALGVSGIIEKPFILKHLSTALGSLGGQD
jgi:two-component system, OmpR family, response regulator ArlR